MHSSRSSLFFFLCRFSVLFYPLAAYTLSPSTPAPDFADDPLPESKVHSNTKTQHVPRPGHVLTVRIDGLLPATIPAGSPETQVDLIGTGLDQISKVNILGQTDEWIELPLSPDSPTRASIAISSSYLQKSGFIIVATEPSVKYGQSILICSGSVAEAKVDPTFKVEVSPDDIGSGGTISITGTRFAAGMRAALGRDNVACLSFPSNVINVSYMGFELSKFIPGNNLFVTVLSPDGETRSAGAPIISSYPQREDEFSQRASGASPNLINAEGMKLMSERSYTTAATKFVEAARLDPSNVASSPFVGKSGALFANNAGFAFLEANKYQESLFWLKRAIEIDPARAVAYLNLGDAYAKLNRYAEARQAYAKYLDLAPASKAAPDVRKKLEALPQPPRPRKLSYHSAEPLTGALPFAQ
jgi:hypothetical protein